MVRFDSLLIRIVVIAGVGSGLLLGCSADGSDGDAPAPQRQTTMGRAVQAANQAATLRTNLQNPRPGHCPVCQGEVDYEHFANVAGKNYAFDSDSCITLFEEKPQFFLDKYENAPPQHGLAGFSHPHSHGDDQKQDTQADHQGGHDDDDEEGHDGHDHK